MIPIFAMAKGAGIFKNIFKRKPGGTTAGNLLRGVANKLSKGKLGNGGMMLKPDETIKEANNRLSYQIGEASETFNDSQFNTPKNLEDKTLLQSFEMGTMKNMLKTKWHIILIPVVLIGAIIYFITKKK